MAGKDQQDIIIYNCRRWEKIQGCFLLVGNDFGDWFSGSRQAWNSIQDLG